MRAVALILAFALPAAAVAQDLDPLIGARLDPQAQLTDATGAPTRLGELLDPGGTLLVLGYHRCTNICGIVQQALAETLIEVVDPPRVLLASLDPEERAVDARAMRADLAAAVPQADLSGWRFLTGPAPALSALSKPFGFEIYVRPGGDVPVHPIAVGVLTPEGALSEIFYGLDFTAGELETALARAGEGDVGGLRERVILLCSGLDEAVGEVARAAWGGIRVAAAAMLVLMALGLVRAWRGERR